MMGRVIMSGIVPTLKMPVAYKMNFADNDWTKIINACHNNRTPCYLDGGRQQANDHWRQKLSNRHYRKNHDDYANGSGKALLTRARL